MTKNPADSPNSFLRNVKPWLSVIILLLFAAFAVIRMETVQAGMIETVNKKLDREVYLNDKENTVRELNLIQASLDRIEKKVDYVIANKSITNNDRH